MNINEEILKDLIYKSFPQNWKISYIEWLEWYFYVTYNDVNYKIDKALNVNIVNGKRDNSCLFLEALLKRIYFKTI